MSSLMPEVHHPLEIMGRKLNAMEYALKLLAVRPRTEKELRRRLKKKGYQQDEVEEALQVLRESRVLDEEEFAESFIKGKMRKLYSRSWIKRELVRSGLREDEVNTLLDEFYNEEEVLSKLTERAKRVFNQLKNSERARQRIYAYVIRHGHSPDIAKTVLEKVLSQ